MDIVIRKALCDDAYDYANCHISCWLSAYKGIVSDEYLRSLPDEIENRTERYKEAFINPGNNEYYCVDYKGKMIGFLFFGKSNYEDKTHAGEVIAIYLMQEFWGKGYGWTMMDYAVERLKQLGYNEILLWTFEKNDRAKRFYEKYGFTHDGELKELSYWGDPMTLVRYVLNIS